ncbi:MAG: homoserine dehydrogenase [Phycisphaeraceae bacterium]|nr:homoserine dehydrogenase [Phycisphaeraceae bacterium]
MAAKTIGIGLIGCGTVGCGVVKLLRQCQGLYAQRLSGGANPGEGPHLEVRKVLVRKLDGGEKVQLVERGLLTTDPKAFFATPGIDVVVEVAGGLGVSAYVRQALSMGKPVVTANKALLAAEGAELFALAKEHHAAIGFEASCGGGIPCITALSFGLMANRVTALHGILNGTCNYILTEMTRRGKSYAVALREAQEAGFAEADPTMDVSGVDTAAKLAVLASLAFGVRATIDQVRTSGIDKLELLDIQFGGELGYDVKLLGIAEQAVGSSPQSPSKVSLSVEPCFVRKSEPLAQVNGSFNALSVFGHAVGQTVYIGRGAGQMPTASAVVSDILNVASGWYTQAFGAMNLWWDGKPAAVIESDDQRLSRYYLRISAKDAPGTLAQVSRVLGEQGISISSMLQHEAAADQFVPVVITTHAARGGALRQALAKIEQLDVTHGPPTAIRILDMPVG